VEKFREVSAASPRVITAITDCRLVDNAVFRLSISQFVPEMLAIELKCKVVKIAPICAPGNYQVADPQKYVPKFSSLYRVDKFGEVNTTASPKVIH